MIQIIFIYICKFLLKLIGVSNTKHLVLSTKGNCVSSFPSNVINKFRIKRKAQIKCLVLST